MELTQEQLLEKIGELGQMAVDKAQKVEQDLADAWREVDEARQQLVEDTIYLDRLYQKLEERLNEARGIVHTEDLMEKVKVRTITH